MKSSGEFFSEVRDAALSPEPLLHQKEGEWAVIDRKKAWLAVAERVYDPHIDEIQDLAVDVLSEIDPALELPADERFTASIKGKKLKYSKNLRRGLAETLALLGTMGDALTSCSHGKGQTAAVLAVRRILEGADWTRWASLNDVVRMLAEAAPEEFLDQLEAALGNSPSPFERVYAQEGTAIMGRNYLTGLLWALEALAWSPQFLLRVTVLLGELAAIDPGGNWSNRPSNSLRNIFLPWHPQTTASVDKRTAAVSTLLREQPVVGWKLLLSLLPQHHDTSSGTQKPRWRDFVPPAWKSNISKREYSDQVKIYSRLAVKAATGDPQKFADLVKLLPQLPEQSFSAILKRLGSKAMSSQPEESRLPVWESLQSLAASLRKFPDAAWAMSIKDVERIEAAALKLTPKSAKFHARRLFSVPDFELFETDNYESEQRKIAEIRKEAVTEIAKSEGIGAVLQFARSVSSPEDVGLALGRSDVSEADAIFLPSELQSEDVTVKKFVGNFVWGRFLTYGWDWAERVLVNSWTDDQKATFLSILPFTKENWERAEKLLGSAGDLYWQRASGNPYHPSPEHLLDASQKLIRHGRPRSALRALGRLVHEDKDVPANLTIKALLQALNSNEPFQGLDSYVITKIISKLQSDENADRSAVMKVEWAYLQLLDRHSAASPIVLEQRLADDPAFFCEIIATVFRSKHEKGKEAKIGDDQKRAAENGYLLLREWERVPGTGLDGNLNEKAFRKWIKEAAQISNDSGHFDIAQHQIGHVLVHAPKDKTGLWINKKVAEVLNEKHADAMRSGFRSKLFNMRGVHGFSAGKEEAQLAASFHEKADALDNQGFFRIGAEIRNLAKQYESDSKREAKRDPLQ